MLIITFYLGESSLVGELTKTIGSLNPAVKSLTGIDLAAAIGGKLNKSHGDTVGRK